MNTGEAMKARLVAIAVSVVLVGGAAAGAAESAGPRADLAVTAVESADPVLVDRELTYRIVVANLGPQRANRVKLSVTLVGSAKVARRPTLTPGSCAVQGTARVLCTLAVLRSKRRATVVVAVDPAELGSVSIAASVSSATADARRRNNRATQMTRVVGFHSVQGRGTRSTMGDAGYPTVTTEIDARGDPTAGGTATGTFAVQYAAISASPARGSDLRGRVVCLSVEGSKAMAGGVVEASNSAAYPAGTAVRLGFTDNGDPGAGRDTSVAFLGGEPTCEFAAVQEQPLIEGNFVVRDGEP
jgi:hypothetical protein